MNEPVTPEAQAVLDAIAAWVEWQDMVHEAHANDVIPWDPDESATALHAAGRAYLATLKTPPEIVGVSIPNTRERHVIVRFSDGTERTVHIPEEYGGSMHPTARPEPNRGGASH